MINQQNDGFPASGEYGSGGRHFKQEAGNTSGNQPKHKNKKDGKNKGGKSRAKKVLLIILAVVLALAIIGVSAFFILKEMGRSSLLGYEDAVIEQPEGNIVADESGKTVTYNGHTYVFNENMTAILCMGVDVAEFSEDLTNPGTSGQADTLILFAMDTATGKSTAISVSRDSMADIDVYSSDGAYIGTQKKQICLAYAYGDGKESSCENTVSAVSRLLYGIPINSYAAVDLEGIGILNDAVGGVEIVAGEDLTLASGTVVKSGEKVNLSGSDAVGYLRARDSAELDSNNDRVSRQQEYLKALASKVISATKDDITFPVKLYSSLSEYTVSSFGAAQITYLTSCMFSGGYSSGIDFRSIPGTVSEGSDGKAEFTPDDIAMYELLLDVFYTQKD